LGKELAQTSPFCDVCESSCILGRPRHVCATFEDRSPTY
jgi:hypothetical protein